MAQRAIASVLRRALDSWAEEAELDAQLLSGSVHLSKARLRQFSAPFGLQCSGAVGKLSATWSWTSLLSSPVVVKVQEVTVVVRPDAGAALAGSSSSGKAGPVSQEVVDESSLNFFQRLTGRIWDQLQLEVAGVHIRLEYPDGGAIGAADVAGAGAAAPAAGAAPLVWAAGIFAERIAVAVVEDKRQGKSLQETVSVVNAGAYIDPRAGASGRRIAFGTWLENELPESSAFVAQGLSPCCRATRHSGRRFADWRGLEVCLEFERPKLSLTHEQYRGALRLVELLRRQQQQQPPPPPPPPPAQSPSRSARGPLEDEEWCDLAAQASPPAASAPAAAAAPAPQRSWWSSWFSLRGSGGGERFPDEVSAEDRALLVAEEAPPAKAATFELDVQLREASLAASDVLLQLGVSSGFHLSYSVDTWTAEYSLSSLSVSETSPDGSLVDVCGRASSGDSIAPQLLLSARSADRLEVSLTVAPLHIQITPVVLKAFTDVWAVTRGISASCPSYDEFASTLDQVSEFAREMVAACCPESEQSPASTSTPASAPVAGAPSAAAASSAWSFTWRLDSVTITAGAPWLRGAHLLLAAELQGSTGSAAVGLATGEPLANGAVAADLLDEQGRRSLVQRSAFSVCFEEGKATARCQALAMRCALHELVALVRAGRDFQAAFKSGAERAEEEAGAEGTELKLEVEQLSVEALDDEACYLAVAHGFTALLQPGRGAITASADPAELHVRAAGEPRALVRLACLTTCWNFRTAINCSLHSAVQVLDCQDPLLDGAAIQCPSLRAALVWDSSDAQVTRMSLQVALASLRLQSSEEFIAACARGGSYLSEVTTSLCAEVVSFSERPLGLQILDAKVLSVSGNAERLGVLPGSTICGIEPAVEGDAMDSLRVCPMPVALLLVPPPQKLLADVSVTPFTLSASLRTAKRAIQVKVDEASIGFRGLQIQGWSGVLSDLTEEVKGFYSASLVKELPWLITATSIGGERVSQTAAGAFGSSLAVLRFGGAAAGAVGCTIAKGVTTFAATSAAKGRELRGAEDKSYRFGDITRGFLVLSRERGRRLRGSFDDRGGQALSSKAADVAVGSISGIASYAKETRAVSSTLGAAIGGSFGAVAGPAGVVAGAAVGSSAMGSVSRSVESAGSAVSRSVSGVVDKGKESRGSEASAGYRFGDLTRGLTAAGREARGGESQGEYKFGDFSRGLFSKLGGGRR